MILRAPANGIEHPRRVRSLTFNMSIPSPQAAPPTEAAMAVLMASGDRTPLLKELAVPALVLHGEADRLVPLSGGIATAEVIPGARLITFPGMGHDLPRRLWPEIVGAIDALTAAAEG